MVIAQLFVISVMPKLRREAFYFNAIMNIFYIAKSISSQICYLIQYKVYTMQG